MEHLTQARSSEPTGYRPVQRLSPTRATTVSVNLISHPIRLGNSVIELDAPAFIAMTVYGCALSTVAWNCGIRGAAWRPVSDRLFFADFARSAHGTGVYESMQEYLVEPQLRTVPQPSFAVPLMSPENASDKIPKLLRAYLALERKSWTACDGSRVQDD